jgi:hypothetical protein
MIFLSSHIFSKLLLNACNYLYIVQLQLSTYSRKSILNIKFQPRKLKTNYKVIHYATNRKVAGSNPDEVDFFQLT